MKKNPDAQDIDFDAMMSGVKKIKQDKVVFSRHQKQNTQQKKKQADDEAKKVSASFEFSDGFESYSDTQQVISFIQPEGDKSELKKLRRGVYAPDLILDLHGLTKEQSKRELAALLHEAHKQRHYCVSIMHGKGNQVLKRAVPNWLMQHPGVMAFHQAPKTWGGESAVLVLMELPEESFTWPQE